MNSNSPEAVKERIKGRKDKKARVNLYVDSEVYKQFKELCEDAGLYVSEVISEIMRNWISDEDWKPMQSEQIPNSEHELFSLFVKQIRLVTSKYSEMFSMLEEHQSQFGTEEDSEAGKNALLTALHMAKSTNKSAETIDFLTSQLKMWFQMTQEEIDEQYRKNTKQGYLDDLAADGFDIKLES